MTSQPKRNQEAFFSGEGRVLKVTFIRGGSTSRSNFFTLSSVADIGKGLGEPGPPPPLIFRPNWGPKGRKNFLFRPGIPLIAGWPPPVIRMSVSAMFMYGTIFDRKRTHFVYLPLTDGTPFTNLHIPEKNSPSYLVSGTTFRNYIVLNLKEQFLCYINLVLDLLRWAGWANSLNKAFQKIAPWLTSLELSFLSTALNALSFKY